jgi:hypothetical protein
MEPETRRISLVIREDQYKRLSSEDVNVSGLIRDLIDDHYSSQSITLNVTEETRKLYDKVVSETPQGDVDIEPYLREALKAMLRDKIREMEKLQRTLAKE